MNEEKKNNFPQDFVDINVMLKEEGGAMEYAFL